MLLTVPHFDDEVLGCGGLLAGLPHKEWVHAVFVTKGDSLPIAGTGADPAFLEEIQAVRKAESVAAMKVLGYGEEQLSFLGLPENGVGAHVDVLRGELQELGVSFNPSVVLCPFRFDQHADHVALRNACRRVFGGRVRILEYFVYYHYPLLPGGDVRAYCKADVLHCVDGGLQREKKLKALKCFVSQTSCYYPAQCRPVLSEKLLDEYSGADELFAEYDEGMNPMKGPAVVFSFLQYIQPKLKRVKEKLRFMISQFSS